MALRRLGVAAHDETLEWLRRALEYRRRDRALLPLDPAWKTLRGRSTFDTPVEAVGFD